VAAAGYFTYQDAQRTSHWMSSPLSQMEIAGDGDDWNGGGGGGTVAKLVSRLRTPGAAAGSSGGVDLDEPLLPTSMPPRGGGPSDGNLVAQARGTGAGATGYDREGEVDDGTGDHLRPLVPVTLTWQDVRFEVSRPRRPALRVLRGVSGVAGHVTSQVWHSRRATALPTPARPSSDGDEPAPLPDARSSALPPSGVSVSSQQQQSKAARAGSMSAILGPSGAGKTTLIDILAGRRYGQGVSGEVHQIFLPTTRVHG
jgi:hypothetical protein